MAHRLRSLAALVIAASTALTGCHLLGNREPTFERWSGPVGELRAQWTAGPGIDLLRGPAVPVRAYLESRWLAQWAGSLDYAYPGFEDAVPANVDSASDIGAGQRRPVVENALTSPLVGNEQFRILSIKGSGRDVTATICNYTYSVSKPNDDGTYFSVASKAVRVPRGIYAEQVSLTAPAEQTQPPLPPQQGPAKSPTADVFGGWKVTGNLSSISTDRPGFVNAWPTYDADTQSCVDQAPDPPARIAFLINGNHPRSDFPTSPPSPGWPQN